MKRSPLAPLRKGGTRKRKENLQVPLSKGDLGGSHG